MSEIVVPIDSTVPAQWAAAVTVSDTVKILDKDGLAAPCTRALWVGVAGDIAVLMKDGGEVVFKNVSGLIPISVQRVNDTDTTATDIVALW